LAVEDEAKKGVDSMASSEDMERIAGEIEAGGVGDIRVTVRR